MNVNPSNLKFMALARTRSGVALPVVVLVLFLLTGLAFGLVELARAEGVVATRNRQHLQAINLAEAGVHWAVAKLRQAPQWEGGQLALGGGTATVAVAQAPEIGDNWLRVASTGAVGPERKTIQQILRLTTGQSSWPSAMTNYAVFCSNEAGERFTIHNHARINGSVFYYGDVVVRRHGRVLDGEVYATGSVTGPGTYTVGQLPDPLPSVPVMDTSHYDEEIAHAANNVPKANWNLNQMGGEYALDGKTYYVDGDVVIRNMTVRGPGRIVATGDIDIDHHVTLPGGVDLVAGKMLRITGSNNYTEMPDQYNHVLFASEGIHLHTHVRILGRGTLMTPGNLHIHNHGRVEGLLWSGTVNVRNHDSIFGAVIADHFTDEVLYPHAVISYDPDVLPAVPPPGIPGAGQGGGVELGAWSENW